MGRVAKPVVGKFVGEAGSEAADEHGLLLDGVGVLAPRLGRKAEEEPRRGRGDLDPHRSRADGPDGVGGMFDVDAVIGADAFAQERPRPRAADLVGRHRAHDDVALEFDAGRDQPLDAADGGGQAALVVLGAEAPQPAVVELPFVGIDGPSGHGHVGVHVAVEHQAGAAAGALEGGDGLARLERLVPGVGDLHHLDGEAHVSQVPGQVVGDLVLLEQLARHADHPARQGDEPVLGDGLEGLFRVLGLGHRSLPFASYTRPAA